MSDTWPLDLIERRVRELEPPTGAWRKAALQGEPSGTRHSRLRAEAACLNTVRIVDGDATAVSDGEPRVVAWNLERCKHVEEAAEVLRREKADICLLTEMDLGMARSGNRDTTAELAARLGMGHVFATEFIELGHGDAREQSDHKEEANRLGLHGNAVLSRYPIGKAFCLPLGNDGFWYTNGGDQPRIGGRIAVAVRLCLPKPLWVVSVHYESRLGPDERAEETRLLLSHLERVAGKEPVLVGGDFNCKGLHEAGLEGAAILQSSEAAEPMFAGFKAAGFDWLSCNTHETTTRNHPWSTTEDRPLKKLDWLFARGLACKAPAVIAAVDTNGRNVSDHEAIAVTLVM
ncbi:endonuclease/exonuclease/phosphatase family protein [Roseibium aggregatum]|uniref:Endonuclease/exonuclease/phosphatase family protein n=1 Tax=Roseibium aggregatum TaxID=187304 RepID=A0A939EHW3_9HYPH|nr:endonuclease/exonuclease/phosphatase family protein [Roseibium aggregatum]MBN9671859.1 endonuclease/exonuclease/phosphatase family protein [Roseibium aggregatum]